MKNTQKIIAVLVIIILLAVGSYDYYASYKQSKSNTNNGKIIFMQAGLSKGVNWTIRVTGTDYTEEQSTNSTQLVFSPLEYGIYSYSIMQESGYTMSQSGETDATAYSGVVQVGSDSATQSNGNVSYPSEIQIKLNFRPITPSILFVVEQTSSNPFKYEIYVTSMSGNLSLNYVNFTVENTEGQKFTLILLNALNKEDQIGGIWNVSVSGNLYLSVNTAINIAEVDGISGDANVSHFFAVDSLTGGLILSITPTS